MRTIGKLIKEEREKANYSRAELEDVTKIKVEFIEALEKSEWGKLPELPVVKGFVKNISSFLKIDSKEALAILRRDYPPRSLSENPEVGMRHKFTWGPKATFAAGIVLIATFLSAYLGYQYYKFVSPPDLIVTLPVEGEIIRSKVLKVEGSTDMQATILVNNQPALVSDDGSFETEIEVSKDTSEVEIVAKSRNGKETILSRKINVEFEN